MIAFIIYLLLITGLIYYNGFFKLFLDESISRKQFSLIFLLKVSAVPLIYLLYEKFYGGIKNFDAGIFYHDSQALNTFAKAHPFEYLKVLLGLQDDSPGSFFYEQCISQTKNWDNGRIRVFFYNDNRIVIRIHSLLHFIAFNSYFVHALFSCFLSFIGITLIYKSLKVYFFGKELCLLLILCFFPTLWLHSGAVLKEGLSLFFLGCLFWSIRKNINYPFRLQNFLLLLFFIFIALLLKPYLLFYASICFALFYSFQKNHKIKYKFLFFLTHMFLGYFVLNTVTHFIAHKSPYEIARARQRVFEDAAKGGIFLLDSVKFVRLDYDSSLLIPSEKKPGYFQIKARVPYIYWNHKHQQDTLFCNSNTDTVTNFQLVYKIEKSGSNLNYGFMSDSKVVVLIKTMSYALFYPLFYNAKGTLQVIASFENLILLLALLFCVVAFFISKNPSFLPLVMIFFALSVCLLVGFTTPNSGAIFRYRSPAVVFILLAALYYSELLHLRKRSSN